MTWQSQHAQAHFDEFLDASSQDGPQVVERDGRELAVLVPIEEWKRLQNARPTLKDLLTAPSPTFDDMMIPERGHVQYREPPEL
jgi:antitoxin Phd